MKLRIMQTVTILIFLFQSGLIFSQQKGISIIVKCDEMPNGSMVHIAGNTDEMGNWNEMLIMKKESAYEWSFKTTADVGDTLQFKFTRGSWRTEAVDSNRMEYPTLQPGYNTAPVLGHWGPRPRIGQ